MNFLWWLVAGRRSQKLEQRKQLVWLSLQRRRQRFAIPHLSYPMQRRQGGQSEMLLSRRLKHRRRYHHLHWLLHLQLFLPLPRLQLRLQKRHLPVVHHPQSQLILLRRQSPHLRRCPRHHRRR